MRSNASRHPEPGKFDLGWCRWANQKRLVCGIYGNIRGKKYAESPYTRLFAVDADGAALKVLEQARNEGNLFVTTTSMRNFDMNYGASIEKSTTSELGARDADTYLEGRAEHLRRSPRSAPNARTRSSISRPTTPTPS